MIIFLPVPGYLAKKLQQVESEKMKRVSVIPLTYAKSVFTIDHANSPTLESKQYLRLLEF